MVLVPWFLACYAQVSIVRTCNDALVAVTMSTRVWVSKEPVAHDTRIFIVSVVVLAR